MFTAFAAALSGLNANTTALDVVGNNLANLNTTGFKASTVSFDDLMSESMGTGSTQIGLGVATPLTLRQFTQGAIQASGGALDAAIQGDGFFIVQTSSGATEYTRGGNFQVDQNGQLTTATGELLQGWNATGGVVNTNGALSTMNVPSATLSAPVASANVSVDLNLDASATAGAANGTFSTPVEVFDSLGASHILTFTFTKGATPNSWDYSASLPPGDTTAAATPLTGTITFDSSGNLLTPLASATPPVFTATGLTDGAADLNISWNLYNGTTPRITQFVQTSATSAQSADGAAAAAPVSVSLGNGGQILVKYSNGQQVPAGQLAMATFRNPASLIAVGNNNYQTSSLTSAEVIGTPSTGGRGSVLGGSLESSTVDIAKEFTNLIVYQRAYEANGKMITTEDQLSQDTINLKQ